MNDATYIAICALLCRAADLAATEADHDPALPSVWANAEAALQLAITGLPASEHQVVDVPQHAQANSLDLAREALRLLDEISPRQRRPEHNLDRAYVIDAVTQVERAQLHRPGRV